MDGSLTFIKLTDSMEDVITLGLGLYSLGTVTSIQHLSLI